MGAIEQIVRAPLRRKILALAVLMVIISAGFWFVFYSPMQEEYTALQDGYTRLVHDKQDADRRKATYDKDRKRRDDLKQVYGRQLRALPSDAEMSSFLNSLNTQAELVGLEILSVKPKKEEPAKYYARIPVELKLTGTFHQLAKFFYLVGNLDRIINIENITFEISGYEESSAILTANVLATTFRAVTETEKVEEKGKGKKKSDRKRGS